MQVETLLVLLFTVFAVPVSCLLVMLGAFVRGLYIGWRWKRERDRYAYHRRFGL